MPLYAYSRPSLQGRTLPVLIGLAIGDAMGATQEFERPENPVPYPALMTGPQVDIVGGGWLELAPGQVTADPLMFPFTEKDWDTTIEWVEGEVDFLWHEANDDEDVEGEE